MKNCSRIAFLSEKPYPLMRMEKNIVSAGPIIPDLCLPHEKTERE